MGRKWNNIKEKKAAKDANTSKIYAKFGRKIYQAAKSGVADPESNRNLKVVLERAKTYRVPKNIIDRLLKKQKVEVKKIMTCFVMRGLVLVALWLLLTH